MTSPWLPTTPNILPVLLACLWKTGLSEGDISLFRRIVMNKNERKIVKLMQYGLDSKLAQTLVNRGYGVSKLRDIKQAELAAILDDREQARNIKKAITRDPIPEDILQRLITECDWLCCFCWNVDKRLPVVVHHIKPYEKTQDNSYDNLVVLCPTDHALVHSKSDLTRSSHPPQLIKQKKSEFIEAIRLAKAGEQPFPGREPFPHYWWGEILRNCHQQVKSSLTAYSNKYNSDLYVNRSIENTYQRFNESDKTCFLIVDKSGQGKSNLTCSLASQLLAHQKAVVLIRGDVNLTDENGLERLLCKALGYDSSNYHSHIDSVAQTLQYQDKEGYIFLDGISESNTPLVANRALLNLLVNLNEYGCFRLCVTCRDVAWHRLGYDLPLDLFFLAPPKNNVEPKHFIGPLSDEELDICLPLYQHKYRVDFTLSTTARNQLKHPLLLRMFCEAHQEKTLGIVSNVPVAKTFDLYLLNKTQAVENRLSYKFKSTLLLRILRLMAFEMWKNNDAKSLDESQWLHILPDSATVERDDGPNGNVTRTINYKFFPRFSGDSYNIPERMALHDIWQEVDNIINKGRSALLLAERAWVIASEIPNIVPEGLDLTSFQNQIPDLLHRFSGQDDESVRIRSQLPELEELLVRLSEPLHIDDHPFYKFQAKVQKYPSETNLQDKELLDYLFLVMYRVIEVYRIMVEENFPNLKAVLNTYVNMPCGIAIITDRINVRYVFSPVKTWDDAKMQSLVIPYKDSGVANPHTALIADVDGERLNFEDAALKELKKLNKMRSTIHPINKVISIDTFFSKTPINQLVREWLLQDLHAIFGL